MSEPSYQDEYRTAQENLVKQIWELISLEEKIRILEGEGFDINESLEAQK